MRRSLTALLFLTGCAASEASESTDQALISATADRPTSAEVTTDRGNQLTTSILVDPPTGAGWASPAVLVSYHDRTHAFGGAQSLAADVTAHFSAPAHDEHVTLQLRLDNTGFFMAPLFLDLADVQHVEGFEISVQHEHSSHLGAIRPDIDDAASIAPYDHIAVRGVQRAATLDDALHLSVTVDTATFAREEVPGYDGHGQAFALVPNGSQWERVSLVGDAHLAAVVSNPDRTTIAAKGIAFGITTNRGTIWLQDPHGNLRP
jgi:hypothetical protein